MSTTFEIHPVRIEAPATAAESLPWHEALLPEQCQPFRVAATPEIHWVAFDSSAGALQPCSREVAFIGLKTVNRKLGSDLAMISKRDDLLVNGLPALPLSVLGSKDSIVLGAGWLGYVTERVKPFLGQPLAEHIGPKCPFCRIPVDASTRIVTCRCGVPYHHETAESHPDTPEVDRLRCFEKVRACLSCNRPLTLEEHLVWDPASV